MKDSVYIGNFNDIIDCSALVEKLRTQQGDKRDVENYSSSKAENSERILNEKQKIANMWISGGYIESNAAEWTNFYPGVHFELEIVEKFSNRVNADPYNIWVSSMCPGKCIPLHWDIIKDYEKYEKDPRVVRYSFFIDKPQIGKAFILNDEVYHNIEQGSVYKWNKWDEWHAGFNCGLSQKFLFHYIGFNR